MEFDQQMKERSPSRQVSSTPEAIPEPEVDPWDELILSSLETEPRISAESTTSGEPRTLPELGPTPAQESRTTAATSLTESGPYTHDYALRSKGSVTDEKMD